MCTYHSIQRANERTRFTGQAAIRFIKNGIERGKTAENFNQNEKKYLAECAYDNCIAKAYNGFCLIISQDGDCVTLYPLPEWFGKKRHYKAKELVRNARQYRMEYRHEEVFC